MFRRHPGDARISFSLDPLAESPVGVGGETETPCRRSPRAVIVVGGDETVYLAGAVRREHEFLSQSGLSSAAKSGRASARWNGQPPTAISRKRWKRNDMRNLESVCSLLVSPSSGFAMPAMAARRRGRGVSKPTDCCRLLVSPLWQLLRVFAASGRACNPRFSARRSL